MQAVCKDLSLQSQPMGLRAEIHKRGMSEKWQKIKCCFLHGVIGQQENIELYQHALSLSRRDWESIVSRRTNIKKVQFTQTQDHKYNKFIGDYVGTCRKSLNKEKIKERNENDCTSCTVDTAAGSLCVETCEELIRSQLNSHSSL